MLTKASSLDRIGEKTADESRRRLKMTFDKYQQGREKFNDCIFPINDGYEYDYVWSKEIGWHIVRGKKFSPP
jgi:hypothetical protein